MPKVPLWLLALFTFSGTLAMHIFVPALPFAAESLHASVAEMQLTVSLYIAGLAVGQLIYGPLSDHFGRRPILMIGLALYAVAGAAASLAPDAHLLIAARLFQALGGCAGLVLGRTIVRDTTTFEESAKRLALMNLMVTVGPGVAPIVGGLLASTLGWRSIFYLLTAMGLVNMLLAWRMLPETGRVAEQASTDLRALAGNYLDLLKSPAFIGYSLGGGCATTTMYAYVASAPFIFVHQLHRPAQEVGFYLAFLIFGIWIGSVLATRLVTRVPMGRLLVVANGISVLAACAFLAQAWFDDLSVAGVLATMFVFTLGMGVASPAALTEAISVNPRVTGSASGLYGFTQMAVGAICTALVGFGSDPALSAGLVLVGAGIVGQAGIFVASRDIKRLRSSSAAAR
ncbi:Bcr/CflA family drug resistance efflux transporter [Rhodoferax koreense]|uniref:Bcr/CflA family efflux transporter n=1 Tax=Rhodoferax koreensis TaxID=1842727 RepID=A0A1P8K438_9BURK|nr:multidrug effflux MFS transporter [Rhodoferax koreense]APW40762.1 Bcr/CflA family drug resistance efflux transporter [Rhodoferax koreense]